MQPASEVEGVQESRQQSGTAQLVALSSREGCGVRRLMNSASSSAPHVRPPFFACGYPLSVDIREPIHMLVGGPVAHKRVGL